MAEKQQKNISIPNLHLFKQIKNRTESPISISVNRAIKMQLTK